MKAVGTNGIGELRYPIVEVQPGCIARFGIDDDMTVMVVANFPSIVQVSGGNGKLVEKPTRHLIYFGCFCDEDRSYERCRLMQQDHDLSETLTIIMMPEYN